MVFILTRGGVSFGEGPPAGDVAGALGLLELLDVGVRKLSADQRKYLGLAVELVGNPSVLFVDEPTTGVGWFAPPPSPNLISGTRLVVFKKARFLSLAIH